MPKQPIDYAPPSSRRCVARAFVAKRLRRFLPHLLAVIVCYVGNYVSMSSLGRYVPARIGPLANGGAGVRWYRWAPAGFMSGHKHRYFLFYFYATL